MVDREGRVDKWAGPDAASLAASAIDELLEPWLGSGKLADRHPSSCARRSGTLLAAAGRGLEAWEGEDRYRIRDCPHERPAIARGTRILMSRRGASRRPLGGGHGSRCSSGQLTSHCAPTRSCGGPMRHITGTSGCTLQGAAMGPWGLVVCGPRQLHLLCSSRGPRRQAFRCATGQALLGWRARVRWPVVLEGAGSEARLTRREHTDRLFPPACGMLAARRRADWPTAAGFEGQVRGFWKRRQSMRGQAHSASVRRSAQWRRSRTLGPPQAVGSGRCERRAHYPSISEAKLHPLRSAGQ